MNRYRVATRALGNYARAELARWRYLAGRAETSVSDVCLVDGRVRFTATGATPEGALWDATVDWVRAFPNVPPTTGTAVLYAEGVAIAA